MEIGFTVACKCGSALSCIGLHNTVLDSVVCACMLVYSD